jgi:hypothetical protein
MPRILPEAVSAVVASSALARAAPNVVAARAPIDVHITVRRFGMAVPFQQALEILDPIG